MPRALEGRVVAALCLIPALLAGALPFASGGFFPDWTAIAALAALGALILRLLVSTTRPTAIGPAVLVAAGALALFAAWTLISSTWSHAPARATLEYDRTLLYLVLLVLFASLPRTDRLATWVAVAIMLGTAIVGGAELVAWCAPDWLTVGDADSRIRLSWPISYWNGAGVLAAIGLVVAAHLTCARRVPVAIAVPAAAAVPIGVAVIFFSVSRGALVATAAGVLMLLGLAHLRTLATGLLATVPASVATVLVANGVHGLNRTHVGAGALREGHSALVLIAACAAAAAVVRLVLVAVDRRLAARPARRLGPRVRVGALTATVALLAVTAVAVDAPARTSDAADRFASSSSVSSDLAPSKRFTSLGNNGRLGHWRVALRDGFDAHPVRGVGSGTFATLWTRYRKTTFTVLDAHSLYLETLAELGLVGIVLLATCLMTMLGMLVRRARRRTGAWGGLAAAAIAWAVAAGYDWMWELPAVTAPIFAAGGLGLARRADVAARDAGTELASRPWRVGGVATCAVLAVLPLAALRSQRHLVTALEAFRRGDCAAATDAALAASKALAIRPEPYELLAYCDVRSGRAPLALRAVRAAIRRDPANWEFRYDEAIIRAAGGRDPRRALRAAVVRNPREPLLIAQRRAFGEADRRGWRRLALAAPVLVTR